MTPSPDLISAVLALPMKARRLLAQQEGPGWWVDPSDPCCDNDPDMSPAILCGLTVRGWAWLPANDTAWMRAALTGAVGAWSIDEAEAIIRISREDGTTASYSSEAAPECAVAALRARFPS